MKTGYLQDPHDPRDRNFEQVLGVKASAKPPAKCSLLFEHYDKMLVQSAESCVGFSIAEALYAIWKLKNPNKQPQLASPLFIWWNSRKTHGAEHIDSGTYIRQAIRQLSKVGFCQDRVYPGTDGNDLHDFDQQPPRLAFRQAFDQRLTSAEYYRITSENDARILSWKQALAAGNPIVFGVPVSNAFLEWKGGREPAPMPVSDADVVGGHAMCALGYDELGVCGPQTWGSEWGRAGWFYLSWDYITQWMMDAWVLQVNQYFSEGA